MKRGQKKQAQAQIITVVLIILLVIVALVVVWNVVKPMIDESAGNIGASAFTIQLKIEEVQMGGNVGAKVRIKRGSGEGDITTLKFIFYDEDGETHIVERTDKIPNELETKVYEFTIEEIDSVKGIEKVSVVPIFGKKSGMEVSEVLDIQMSCLNILNSDESTGNGTYWIDPDGKGGEDSFQVYCDMETDGGGWTLVARFKRDDTATFTDDAAGVLTSPSQGTGAKLSDVVINEMWRSSPEGVFMGWHDDAGSATYSMGAEWAFPKFLKIMQGSFVTTSAQLDLEQQCSCDGVTWSATYGYHPTMAGVYNHNGGQRCTSSQAEGGCDNGTPETSLFLYYHPVIDGGGGTFPGSTHGNPGGTNGWLFIR